MCMTVETVTECLGKPIVDPYGRRLGYVISYYSDVDGRVKSFEVDFNGVYFREIPVERFKITPEGIVLLPEYEYESLVVEGRLRHVKSRLASLEELNARKEIAIHVYESLRKKLEEELAGVKTKAKEVKEKLRNRLHELEEQIAELEKAMGALKTGYLANEVQEKAYLSAMDIMKKSMEVLLKEKENVKKHLDKIESLEALPLPSALTTQQVKENTQEQKQPVNVVLVE